MGVGIASLWYISRACGTRQVAGRTQAGVRSEESTRGVYRERTIDSGTRPVHATSNEAMRYVEHTQCSSATTSHDMIDILEQLSRPPTILSIRLYVTSARFLWK